MSVIVFLIFSFIFVSDASSFWFLNNSFYKYKSIHPIPVEISSNVSKSIWKGAEIALEYCQSVFKWDKWNCPTSSFHWLPKQPPNKETAFSQAILAAGVVYKITKDCSRGQILECGCDTDLGPPSAARNLNTPTINVSLVLKNFSGELRNLSKWSWGGCSDDPRFGLSVAKKLFNSLETRNDAAGFVGRHNYIVGSEIIRDSMVKTCRCHGVSGSCSVQTCWMQVSSFEEVARRLRAKYKKAERLTPETIEGNSARELPDKKIIPVKRSSLVYLMQSPDYCLPNTTEGLPGTKRRKCSRITSESTSIDEKRSCRNLCKACGYKVKRITKKVTRKCNCKFVYCCQVKCETCVVDVDEHFCE